MAQLGSVLSPGYLVLGDNLPDFYCGCGRSWLCISCTASVRFDPCPAEVRTSAATSRNGRFPASPFLIVHHRFLVENLLFYPFIGCPPRLGGVGWGFRVGTGWVGWDRTGVWTVGLGWLLVGWGQGRMGRVEGWRRWSGWDKNHSSLSPSPSLLYHHHLPHYLPPPPATTTCSLHCTYYYHHLPATTTLPRYIIMSSSASLCMYREMNR